ncbi:hypothetical protein B0H14DRAFT_2582441 [Mycena olivaceomarginata]|nr:hypothetical protein B0H14DRAFT_2582441 [Mycena olivaceomarginata]
MIENRLMRARDAGADVSRLQPVYMTAKVIDPVLLQLCGMPFRFTGQDSDGPVDAFVYLMKVAGRQPKCVPPATSSLASPSTPRIAAIAWWFWNLNHRGLLSPSVLNQRRVTPQGAASPVSAGGGNPGQDWEIRGRLEEENFLKGG